MRIQINTIIDYWKYDKPVSVNHSIAATYSYAMAKRDVSPDHGAAVNDCAPSVNDQETIPNIDRPWHLDANSCACTPV